MTKSTPASADKMRRKALAALATLGLPFASDEAVEKAISSGSRT